MSECPHSIPQHQCVTITDLVTNSTNTSINGGMSMSINVFFIAGTHVPKTSGWIIVGNPYFDQKVSANFTAISNEKNQQNAIIDCGSGHPISFVFLQLLSLTLKKNIELQNCGFKLSFKKQFNGPESLNETTSSVIVMNVPELVIANINITSSRGAGMVIILVDGNNSNMVRLNEIVIHGSNHTGNSRFGGNLHVGTPQENTLGKPTNISITSSTFSSGIGRCLEELYECSSGGLTFSLSVRSSPDDIPDVNILINRCKFMGNKAYDGGGISLYMDCSSITRSAHIHIKKTMFSRNTAVFRGGGFACTTGTYHISETVFRYNSADYGGATCTTNTELYFDKCTFIGNEARLGAAINSQSDEYPEISNSTFINNTCTDKPDYEREETGTIHAMNGLSLFIKDVEITGNDCRGFYLYEEGLKLSGTSVINGNHAQQSDGGAILFECLTYGENFITFDTQSLTSLSIINNTADGYGGGIATRHCGNFYCFFKNKLANEIRIMKHNTAMKGGDAIYGDYLGKCQLWDIFDITERNSSSAVSSPPNKVCVCSDDFPQRHTCSHSMQLDTYPGQRFQVPL